MSASEDPRTTERRMAEELLATGGLPSEAPPPYDRVAEVLAAAAAAPSDRELAPAAAFGTRLAAIARRQDAPSARGLGMGSMFSRLRAKVPNVAVGVMVGLLFGGSAYAVGEATSGIHGGPKPRFHDAKVCNLVDVKTLPGNWTHGDYVSAVEKKDPSKVREAAQSQCGKPDKAAKQNGKQKNKQKGADEKEKPDTPKATPKKSTPAAPKTPTPSPSATASPSPTEPTTTPSPTASTSAAATPST